MHPFHLPQLAWPLLLLLAGPLAAQVVRGTVTDQVSGEPLGAARVAVLDPDSSVRASGATDGDGEFRLAPTAGRFILRVDRQGYATVWSRPLEMTRTDTLNFEIRLPPAAVEVAALAVVAPHPVPTDPSGFYRRRREGDGIYLGPEEIRRRRATYTSELLADIPGFEYFDPTGRRTLWVTSRGRGCAPTVYLNGGLAARGTGTRPESRERPMEGGVHLDAIVNAAQVAAMEVYQRGTDAPLQFRPVRAGPGGGGDCAVVVVWTRSALGQ